MIPARPDYLPLPDHAQYGGSKIVPQYLVEALAREFGSSR
jgi:hypothetical protein